MYGNKVIGGAAFTSGGTLAHTGAHNVIGYAVAAVTICLFGAAFMRFARSLKKG